MIVYQVKNQVLVSETVELTNSAVALTELVPDILDAETYWLDITNLDDTGVVYVGYDENVSPTDFLRKLSPTDNFEDLLRKPAVKSVYLVASTTLNIKVVAGA